MKPIKYFINEAVKPENGEDWEVYVNNKLDDLDMEIIDCINSGYSERRTAEELGKGKTTIQQRMGKICRRIALYYTYLEIIICK